MDARTLEALQASIAKWEKNAEANSPREYSTRAGSCPLCELFIADECARCPVFEKTKRRYCNGTPYRAAAEAKMDWIYGENAAESAHAAARAEVAFLKSLLPADEVAS